MGARCRSIETCGIAMSDPTLARGPGLLLKSLRCCLSAATKCSFGSINRRLGLMARIVLARHVWEMTHSYRKLKVSIWATLFISRLLQPPLPPMESLSASHNLTQTISKHPSATTKPTSNSPINAALLAGAIHSY